MEKVLEAEESVLIEEQEYKRKKPLVNNSIETRFPSTINYSELVDRAKNCGYTVRLPRMKKQKTGKNFKDGYYESTRRGFEKRMRNWLRGLVQMEETFTNYKKSLA
jgi:hypothetical protein